MKTGWFIEGSSIIVVKDKNKILLKLEKSDIIKAKNDKYFSNLSNDGTHIIMKQKNNNQYWYVNGNCVVVFSEKDVKKICNI